MIDCITDNGGTSYLYIAGDMTDKGHKGREDAAGKIQERPEICWRGRGGRQGTNQLSEAWRTTPPYAIAVAAGEHGRARGLIVQDVAELCMERALKCISSSL